jgi:hypothetical protein
MDNTTRARLLHHPLHHSMCGLRAWTVLRSPHQGHHQTYFPSTSAPYAWALMACATPPGGAASWGQWMVSSPLTMAPPSPAVVPPSPALAMVPYPCPALDFIDLTRDDNE